MDDTSPKPAGSSQANIDELVKELSRPQGSSSSPSASPSPQPMTPPSSSPAPIPPRPTPPPSVTAPAAPAMPKPVTPTTPPAPAVPKEYQSSIRTMSDDLAKIKAGQQPQGTNIPRTVPIPAPVAPVTPPKPTAPVSKPESMSSLPPNIKSAPLPPKATPAPIPAAPTLPPRPPQAAPSATLPPTTKTPGTYSMPPADVASKPSSRRPLILIGALVLVVILGVLYWYFMIQNGTSNVAESPIPTFTPRPTATPNLDPLGTAFPTKGGTIVLPPSGDPTGGFAAALGAQPNIIPGSFTAIDIVSGPVSPSPQVLGLLSLFDRFGSKYPTELHALLGRDFKMLIYGQKEAFDAKGHPVVNPPASNRFVMISELAGSADSVMQTWESTMSTDLAGIMGIAPAKNKGPVMTTLYNGASVRFKNFPYPDHSIDYGVVSFQGKNYLIIAGSREAMFAAIDVFVIKGK